MALLLFLVVSSLPQQGKSQQFQTTIDGWNAYVHLPPDYSDSLNKKYPVIIFAPGVGEFGTDASKLLTYGPSHFIALGDSMKFMVNHAWVWPIVISIQPVEPWVPNPWIINTKLDSIMARWRCDPTRLNLTGLSMGGQAWDNYVNGWDPAFTNRPTSIVAMSAVAPDGPISNMSLYASAGGKWWGFEGTQDYHQMDQIRDYMNASEAASARYTQYIGGHCCWNIWYDPSYNEYGESIYTWMLKQRKEGYVPIPNIAPESYAGSDATLSTILPIYTLTGAANDPDGNNFSFQWTKISGPAGVIIGNPNSPTTTLIGLGFGSYQYQLKITDTLGATGYDTITVYNGLAPVPVKLTDFTAILQKEKVLLQWKTIQEINSDHFEVERSNDGQTFINIGNVTASNNSATEKKYQVNDGFPVKGLNYYRLKLVDKDGKSEYSKIVSINIKNISAKTVFISGASIISNTIKINISSTKDQSVGLNVIDANGKTLQQLTAQLMKGNNSIVKSTFLAKGIYYIRLDADIASSSISVYGE